MISQKGSQQTEWMGTATNLGDFIFELVMLQRESVVLRRKVVVLVNEVFESVLGAR